MAATQSVAATTTARKGRSWSQPGLREELRRERAEKRERALAFLARLEATGTLPEIG